MSAVGSTENEVDSSTTQANLKAEELVKNSCTKTTGPIDYLRRRSFFTAVFIMGLTVLVVSTVLLTLRFSNMCKRTVSEVKRVWQETTEGECDNNVTDSSTAEGLGSEFLLAPDAWIGKTCVTFDAGEENIQYRPTNWNARKWKKTTSAPDNATLIQYDTFPANIFKDGGDSITLETPWLPTDWNDTTYVQVGTKFYQPERIEDPKIPLEDTRLPPWLFAVIAAFIFVLIWSVASSSIWTNSAKDHAQTLVNIAQNRVSNMPEDFEKSFKTNAPIAARAGLTKAKNATSFIKGVMPSRSPSNTRVRALPLEGVVPAATHVAESLLTHMRLD